MHEMGVAQSVLDIVRGAVPPARAADVRAVRVRIGQMAGVLPESLDFCFGAIVMDTPFRSAYLVLERVPVTCVCAGCGLRFGSDGPAFACPSCRAGRIRMVAGGELQVVDVELDDRPGGPA
jgi:hydrogenase nickel incorporation protein HypA/HybF